MSDFREPMLTVDLEDNSDLPDWTERALRLLASQLGVGNDFYYPLITAAAEIAHLRRVNERLVEALRVARAWMPVIPPVDECAREDCEIVEAALHSATETKGDPT